MTREVWEGSDYVPFVWKHWLSDPYGSLVVAERENQVVGLQHHALQPDGIAWLEGIRVAPEHCGTGVAGLLVRDGLEWARRRGCATVRLSTASHNVASSRLAEKSGFEIIGRHCVLSGTPVSTSTSSPVRLAAVTEINELAKQWKVPGGDRSIYTEGWTAYTLTGERLSLLIATGAVAVTGGNHTTGTAIATCTEPFTTLEIGKLTGDEESVRALCQWLVSGAHAAGMSRVRATIEGNDETIRGAEAAGLAASPDFHMIVHELTLGTRGY